jgi:hypothetical protein
MRKAAETAWEPRKPKWDWRAFLTIEERDKLSEAWDAKQHWLALNRERAAITNRAIQLAKYAASKAPAHV